MRTVRRTRRPLLALVALVIALAVGYSVRAADSNDAPKSGPSVSSTGSTDGVALSTLPSQVADTVALIRSGGPFPYPDDDGVVFHNYEHVLPPEVDGYYHEYTVPTPGSDDRGARRIVTGKNGEYYYTADHYDTFNILDLTR